MESMSYTAVENLHQEEKNQMLVSACEKGNLDAVKTLVSVKAKVNAVDNHGPSKGYTALYHAVYWNKPSIVQYLISQNVKIDEKSVEENEKRLSRIISAEFLNEIYNAQQIVDRYTMHGMLTSKTTQEILEKLQYDMSEVEKQHESQYDGKCITKKENINRYKEAIQLSKKQTHYTTEETSRITFKDIEDYLSTISSKEDEKARNIRIMLVGNEGVGKTSLCINLLEEDLPDGGPERTDGIDIFIQRFVIDMVTKSRKKIPEGQEHHNILQKLSDSMQKHKRSRSNSNTDRSAKKQRKTKSAKDFNSVDNEQKMSDPECSNCNDSEETEMDDGGRIPDKSEELYNDLHHVLSLRSEEEAIHNKCYASFWDFSGERDYYNTHHVFLTSHAVYILVFKLSDCVDTDKWLERMIFWLRSIASYSTDNDTEKPKGGPPIILIGTHLDQLQGTEQEINFVIKNVYRKLVNNETARKIVSSHVRGIYQISNVNNNDQVIATIWEDILSSAPLQSQWERNLPNWWLERERVLMKRKANNVKIQTFAEIKEITQHISQPHNTDTDVKMFLRYMHLTGDIVVSNIDCPEDATIIIDPQWLAHAFRRLITSPKTEIPFSGGRFDVLWPIFEKTAVLSMELIELAWKRDKKDGFIYFKNELLNVMENFGLVARVLWDEEEITREGCYQMKKENTEFIVPCMLPDATPNTLSEVLNKENVVNTCTLCFVFENGLMQFSVFDKIIACCIQRLEPFTDDLSNKTKFVQRGFVCLHLTCKWKVIICCKDEVMKVTLFMFSKSNDIEAGAGLLVRELLEKLLENVWKISHQTQLEFKFEFHNKFEVQEGERRIKASDLKMASEPLGFNGDGTELTGTDYDVWFLDRADKPQVQTIEDEEIVKQGIRADILGETVSERTLSDISQFIGKNFYLLFAELGISMSEIDKVLRDYNIPNYRNQIQNLFRKWHAAKGQDATNRVMYQAILKHGINLQHKAEQEDLKSRKSNYKGISKSTHHKNVQSIDQNLKHEMPINALTFRQRDILSEKDDIIYGFKDYINSLQQYLLYDTWLGYIPDGTNAWKLTKNVRIVALYNEKFSPVCPLPDKFLDISIYWRQKNVVSTEASMLLKHENIHNSHQREFSKETSKGLFRKHSKLAIIHPTTIKSKHFATSDQRVDKTSCIALYCQIKGIIPLGEREFDRVIDGWTIDVREGFCTFTVGGDLRPGTAIAGQATGDAGTMGAFVEDNSGRTAFITASHVVVNSSIRTYNSKQREEYLQTERIPVFRNTDPGDHIGNVIDWCFTSGDRNQRQGGVDAALVEVNKKLISTENMFPANKENLWKEEGYDGDELPKISTDKVLTRKDINEKSMLDSRILKYGMKTRITNMTVPLLRCIIAI